MGRRPKKKRELTFKGMEPIYNKMNRCIMYYEGKYETPEYKMAEWIKRLIDKNYLQIAMDVYKNLSLKHNFWKKF